eukprot:jgi/Mesen1/9861/ME000070S09143
MAAADVLASSSTLFLDSSPASNAVRLLVNYCCSNGGSEVKVEIVSGQAGPKLVTPSGEVAGTNTILRHVATAGASPSGESLLGGTPESAAEVSQWLSWPNTRGSGLTASARLEAINFFLGPRAVLVGAGTKISAADIAMFAYLYNDISNASAEERAQLPNLVRWFDFIQTRADLERVYPRIAIEKPKFSPPAPLPPAVKAPSAAKAATSSASQGQAGASVPPSAAPTSAAPASSATPSAAEGPSGASNSSADSAPASAPAASGVLCASNEDHTQCQPLLPPLGAAIGERVSFQGHEGKPEEVLNPKKKQLEKILPELKTDGTGVAQYAGVPFMTSAGACTSPISNAFIK